MIRLFLLRFVVLAGLFFVPSCHKKNTAKPKSAENIARDKEVQSLAEAGSEMLAVFEQMPGIVNSIRDRRSLTRAEQDLNQLQKQLKEKNRQIRQLPVPKPEIKYLAHKKLLDAKQNMLRHLKNSAIISEKLPVDLRSEGQKMVLDFIASDHGTGPVIHDYFKPTYPKGMTSDKEFMDRLEIALENMKANPPEALASGTGSGSPNEDLPILPEDSSVDSAEPVKKKRLPAQIVEE